MTELVERLFVVAGPNETWQARHGVDRPVGPDCLDAAGAPLVADMTIAIDDMADSLSVVDGVRLHQRGGEAIVRGTGHLPFGSEPRIVWASRYTDGCARFTVDLAVPRGTVLGSSLQLGSCRLPGDWLRVSVHGTDGSVTELDLSDAALVTWEQPVIPLLMVFTRADGMQLEVGSGGDVWRWQQGLLGSANRGRISLDRQEDGWLLGRHVTAVDEDTTPDARTYRITHYLAWNRPPATAAPAVDGIVATWRPNGDLALRQLTDLAPGQALIIDMASLDLHENLLRDQAPGGPCLASSRVQKRLKRIVRQIANLERQDFPIRFRHLTAGLCGVGRHIDRNGVRLHSDVGGLLDIATWLRGQLGPERDIAIDAPAADRPLMHVLFRPEQPTI